MVLTVCFSSKTPLCTAMVRFSPWCTRRNRSLFASIEEPQWTDTWVMHNTFWSVKLSMQGYIPYLLATVMIKGARRLAVILGSSQNLRVGVARFWKSRALIFCLLPSNRTHLHWNFDHFPSIWEGSPKFYYVAFFPQIIWCKDSMQGKWYHNSC